MDFAPDDGMLDDPAAGRHGTNVSGIVVGVAPDTKVLGLDVFNARRQFPLSRPATAATVSVEVCDDNAGAPAACRAVPEDGANGWTFDGDHNFARALWARGNSWITIVIPEFIELLDLPEGDPTRRHLLSLFRRQAAALRDTQDESGLWHTLLDDPDSYLEASATAGFAYGLLKGVRRRYLPAEYAPVAERAIRAVIDNISPEGELRNVSFGTAMGSDLDYYRQIPRTSMPYGQAMAMLALAEYLRGYL